jgi:superfamily II DNA helicase RecQ
MTRKAIWWKKRTGLNNAINKQMKSSRHTVMSLEDCIARIHMMDLKELPDIVLAADEDKFIQYQWRILHRGLKLILKNMDPRKDREPKDTQVRILRRMIYGRGDVLCIARTGFGKSLIFHAFSILTGKITLQIIPLSKLGDEQFQDIKKLDGARPCLLTAESKKSEKDLVQRIKHGEFTHILLGPEQASSKTFRQALKSPELQRMIGLRKVKVLELRVIGLLKPSKIWFLSGTQVGEFFDESWYSWVTP